MYFSKRITVDELYLTKELFFFSFSPFFGGWEGKGKKEEKRKEKEEMYIRYSS